MKKSSIGSSFFFEGFMKKWIWIVVLILIVILLLLLVWYFGVRNRVLVLPKQDTVLEIYEPIDLKDVISLEEGTVISKEYTPTSLGDVTVSFQYQTESNRKRNGEVTFSVVDTVAPYVHLSNSYSISVGSDDFVSDILCADNYDANPSCIVEGEYDLNTVGTYPLTFVATDSSSNVTEKDFTLRVYQPSSGGGSPTTPKGTSLEEVVSLAEEKDMSFGIDVSKWQEDIDWEAVKESGVSFVMIRIGSQKGIGGEYVLDPYFEQNYKGATSVDLPVGVYFYSYGKDVEDAKNQAQWIIDTLDGRKLDLPVAFDWECFSYFNQFDLSLYGLNEVAESFFQTIEDAGYETMLYGSKNYLNNLWIYNQNDIWLAHYTKSTDYDKAYQYWQFTNQGKIPGISGFVDINFSPIS